MPKLSSKITAILLLFVVTAMANDATAEDFPQQIQAGQHRLILNGSGSRTKYLLEMYVAGLYLSNETQSPAAIAGADEAMSIRIKITSGFVSQEKLVDSLTEGFRNATGGNVTPIQPQINQFRKCFAETITKGDTYDFIYLPKYGVAVHRNAKLKGVIAGIEFKKALFDIWLSDNPADENLKNAMLTKPTRR
ncbi:chalcone isomerase family protein [Aporhodopirellula aestuarii]|uniref:Chalcone isomerase family protein n=1 Tax=Aporhodopirellula aestuarii TaxID=2950107 RepID=A0ABT0U167_9BACT|nr:chalcone isomerase family protein [Aporhodopirellula aestuarii]MCM2370640.1 chalcone isomerase family protein [Aporhodopirellula aestuarii]